MKNIIIILMAVILTSCTTTKDITEGLKNKAKNLGKNPCYNKETKTVEIGCKK